jgi:BCD family chlorophyll transporter-like MFS transporter
MFLAFVVYGFGRNMAHNSFQALLAEKFSGGSKRYITLFEVATLFGSVMAAGAIGKMLETYDPARLVSVAVGVGILVIVLAVTATLGQENRKFTITSEQARQKDFGKAVRELILFDPQARLFFVLVLFTFIGTLAQDVLLEPYGALVLNMSVGETTRLTAFWGIGVLISMLLSGTLLLKWLDYKLVLRIGLIISLLTFIGLVVVGLAGNPTIFRQLVLVMGLGSGLAGAGLLTGVISFTTPVRAGLLMGVWGMANLLGRAVGSLMGGAIVDGIQLLSGNAFSAYAVVFALEAVMLGISLVLSFRLQIEGALAQQEAQEFELASATAN